MGPLIRVGAIGCAGIVAAGAISVHLFAHDRTTTKVSWNREVSRIVEARCVSCHTEGGRAPMPLRTYEQARPWARAIKDEVLARRMPKWHAARGYGDFANDPSLSPFEVSLIAAWVDGGAPRTVGPAQTDADERNADPASSPPGNPGSQAARELTLPCGTRRFSGKLLAVRPRLAKDGSAAISARLPDGRREIIAWIRNYDPRFPTTYWLRTPLTMPPGSSLEVETSGGECSVSVRVPESRMAQ
jgi:hypothetical protein